MVRLFQFTRLSRSICSELGDLEHTRRGALSDVTLISKGRESAIVNIIFNLSAGQYGLTLVKYDILPRNNHVMIGMSEQVSREAIVAEMENAPAHVRREVYNLSTVAV